MTIEEIINKHCQRCNIPFDTIEALCQEVRRLTIEECKNRVNDYFDNVPYYHLNKLDAEDSFPTNLNNIEI